MITSRRCAIYAAFAAITTRAFAYNASTPLSTDLFDYERHQLSVVELQNLTTTASDLFTAGPHSAHQTGPCVLFPGDSDWPSPEKWSLLSELTDRALLRPLPASNVCYNNTGHYDAAACNDLTANWSNLLWHTHDPLEMLSPFYQCNTCIPASLFSRNGTCTQGGYPMYVVNASSVRDIQLAVNFARNTGVRLVVKNTGHDFNGKSGGAGSLSIWMHHFKEMNFTDSFDGPGSNYTGPALKAGAGVQAFELYAAARELGLVVVGGECMSIGVMGGYMQGGGHSPLSSVLGMAADHVLGFEVVLANGSFVTANAVENSDLFWALRGGGGGAFGIVTSVIVKAHKDIPVATATLSLTSAGMSKSTFWSAFYSFTSHFPAWADAGFYTYFLLFANTPSTGDYLLNIIPFFAPNKTITDVQNSIQPFLDTLASLNITTPPTYQSFPTFWSAWNASFPLGTPVFTNMMSASRLWPRDNFVNPDLFNKTFAAIKTSAEANYSPIFGYSIAPTLSRGGVSDLDTSVNPAWRTTTSFMYMSNAWSINSTSSQIRETWDKFETYMDRWRELSPGAGSYLNEADALEPRWQWSLYGRNYPRLMEVKKKYDPTGLFWAHHAVGSEGWKVESEDGLPTGNGRLCRVEEGDQEQWVDGSQ